MSCCCYRLRVGDLGVFCSEPFPQNPVETILSIPTLKTIEVIPAHLVDHHPDDQFGLRGDNSIFLCFGIEKRKAATKVKTGSISYKMYCYKNNELRLQNGELLMNIAWPECYF